MRVLEPVAFREGRGGVRRGPKTGVHAWAWADPSTLLPPPLLLLLQQQLEPEDEMGC